MGGLNLQLAHFDDVVSGLGDDRRLGVAVHNTYFEDAVDFNVRAADADAGLRARRDISANNGRRETQFDENNHVRQLLLDAVKVQFRAKTFMELPQSVRDAFKVGILKNDLGLDDQGRVTSGRPLTARRVRAVLNAVRAESAKVHAARLANVLYAEHVKINPKNLTEQQKQDVRYFLDIANGIPPKALTAFDEGGDARKFIAFLGEIDKAVQAVNRRRDVPHVADSCEGPFAQSIVCVALFSRMSAEGRGCLRNFLYSGDGRATVFKLNGSVLDDRLDADEERQRRFGRIANLAAILADSMRLYNDDPADPRMQDEEMRRIADGISPESQQAIDDLILGR